MRVCLRGGSYWDLLSFHATLFGWRASRKMDLSSLYVLETIHRGYTYGGVAVGYLWSFMSTGSVSLTGGFVKN